jgi:hypothetical protein
MREHVACPFAWIASRGKTAEDFSVCLIEGLDWVVWIVSIKSIWFVIKMEFNQGGNYWGTRPSVFI